MYRVHIGRFTFNVEVTSRESASEIACFCLSAQTFKEGEHLVRTKVEGQEKVVALAVGTHNIYEPIVKEVLS